MSLYQKFSPLLMIVGFLALAVGVFLSMSAWQTTAYVLVGFGLITYIVGRIGVYFVTKNPAKIESEEKELS